MGSTHRLAGSNSHFSVKLDCTATFYEPAAALVACDVRRQAVGTLAGCSLEHTNKDKRPTDR